MGRDSNLTGRLPIWRLSIAAMLHRPLLGSGWDAFWPGPEGDTIRSLVRWVVPHAHNGFLEISLNIGLIGLAIFMVCNYDCFRRALRYANDLSKPLHLWPLLFYSFTFFFFFTEAPPVDRHSLMFILFCALSVSMTEEVRMEAIEYRHEQEWMPSKVAFDSPIQES
jgi:exopolysaccharide production protein ExoQ